MIAVYFDSVPVLFAEHEAVGVGLNSALIAKAAEATDQERDRYFEAVYDGPYPLDGPALKESRAKLKESGLGPAAEELGWA